MPPTLRLPKEGWEKEPRAGSAGSSVPLGFRHNKCPSSQGLAVKHSWTQDLLDPIFTYILFRATMSPMKQPMEYCFYVFFSHLTPRAWARPQSSVRQITAQLQTQPPAFLTHFYHTSALTSVCEVQTQNKWLHHTAFSHCGLLVHNWGQGLLRMRTMRLKFRCLHQQLFLWHGLLCR